MDDKGAVTVEWAIWSWPAILVILGLLQVGLWWVDRDLCLIAAQDGLSTGRVVDETPADAMAAARSFLGRAGGAVSAPKVSTAGTTRNAMSVEVSVDVTEIVPIPGLDWRVSEVVTGARERFTDPGDTDENPG